MIYCQKLFRLWSKNVGPKCSGVVSIDHYCSQKLWLQNKGLGNHLTLNNLYAFNVHKNMMFVFELIIITDATTIIKAVNC